MARHKMRRVKISELDKPKAGMYVIHVDSWWAVSHDDEVYFFGTDHYPFSSPQCNANEAVARRICGDLAHHVDENIRYENFKETRQIPVIYRPTSASEYM